MVESILEYHCSELYHHFVLYKVTSQVYGWLILQSFFSETLPASDWVILWDHFFCQAIPSPTPSPMLSSISTHSQVNPITLKILLLQGNPPRLKGGQGFMYCFLISWIISFKRQLLEISSLTDFKVLALTQTLNS